MAEVLKSVLEKENPSAVFSVSSVTKKDLFPRLAWKLSSPALGDVTDFRFEGEKLFLTRPLFSGKALGEFEVSGKTPCVLFAPGKFQGENV